MIRKLQMVFAVTLVLVLALSSGVWAATLGEPISNTLNTTIEATVTDATIAINDLDTTPPVTLTDDFSVTTTGGSYLGRTVRVKIELLSGDRAGFDLLYKENHGTADTNDDEYLPLTFTDDGVNDPYVWYGPTDGFPLADATSNFRVTWKSMGTYQVKLTVIDQSGTETDGIEYVSTTETITVGEALTLGWDMAATCSATVNDQFTFNAWANKSTELSSVDRVLYVIEIDKGGTGALDTDLTVTVSGDDGSGGATVSDVPLGYLEPGVFYFGDKNTGFSFTSGTQVDNTFTATILSPGTYTVSIYAVQLPAQ